MVIVELLQVANIHLNQRVSHCSVGQTCELSIVINVAVFYALVDFEVSYEDTLLNEVHILRKTSVVNHLVFEEVPQSNVVRVSIISVDSIEEVHHSLFIVLTSLVCEESRQNRRDILTVHHIRSLLFANSDTVFSEARSERHLFDQFFPRQFAICIVAVLTAGVAIEHFLDISGVIQLVAIAQVSNLFAIDFTNFHFCGVVTLIVTEEVCQEEGYQRDTYHDCQKQTTTSS